MPPPPAPHVDDRPHEAAAELWVELAPDHALIADVRRRSTEWVARQGYEGPLDDVGVVLSELLTNAAEAADHLDEVHASGLRVVAAPDRVDIEVANPEGAELPPGPPTPPGDVLRERGRGLVIVQAIAARVEFIHERVRHVVRVALEP